MGCKSNFDGIPTRSDFVSYSTPKVVAIFNAKRTNPLLIRVDEYLDEYHTDRLQGRANSGHVFNIARSCCLWLDVKKKKASRWGPVKRLLTNCLVELRRLLDNYREDLQQRYALNMQENKYRDLEADLEVLQRNVHAYLTRPMIGQLNMRFGRGDYRNTFLAKQFILDCITTLEDADVRPKAVRLGLEEMLAKSVFRILHLFPQSNTPLYNPGTGFNLPQLRIAVTRVNAFRKPGISHAAPDGKWKRILKKLEDRLGDYAYGKTLEPAYWGETIGVGENKDVHLYGGGVGFNILKKHTDFEFTHGREYGKPVLNYDPADYLNKAALLLQKSLEDRKILYDRGGGKSQLIKIRYFDDEDRALHLLHGQGGQLGKKVPPESEENSMDEEPEPVWTPYDSGKGSGLASDLYAMDLKGRMYAISDDVMKEYDAATRHSSMLAGKAALCAGNIYCYRGRLLIIDNDSGHYKPTTANLLKLLSQIQYHYKIPLNTFLVMDQAQSGLSHQGGTHLAAFPADLFAQRWGRVSVDESIVYYGTHLGNEDVRTNPKDVGSAWYRGPRAWKLSSEV